MHGDQKRPSGAPYISHPVAVACILRSWAWDSGVCGGRFTHDVVEDTPVDLEQVRKMLGDEIANLTNGVTKLGRIPLLFSGRAASGKPAEDVDCNGGRHPRDYHQIGGPPAQYADHRIHGSAEAARQGIGEHGGVCPHRAPPWYPDGERGVGGHFRAIWTPLRIRRLKAAGDAQRRAKGIH